MLFLTGSVLLLIALASGLALLATPFVATTGGDINWVAFPAGAIVGATLFMFSPDTARATRVCGLAGGGLILLGLGGLVMAFLAGNGMLTASQTGPLWFVAVVGLLLGSGGLGIKALLDRRQAGNSND